MTERDPIKGLADWLIEQGLADSARLDQINSEVKSEIETAVQFALSAPFPSREQAEQDVYA